MPKEIFPRKKGTIPWNKGKKGVQVAWNKGLLGYGAGQKRPKQSLAMKGRVVSEETKKKISIRLKGKPKTTGSFQKGHPFHKGGEKGWFKKIGEGITPINRIIRNSKEYKLWRRSVWERDGYACIWCSSKENLQADHIKPFSLFPELRFAIDNGRTLCFECHKKTDTYGGKLLNNKNEQ